MDQSLISSRCYDFVKHSLALKNHHLGLTELQTNVQTNLLLFNCISNTLLLFYHDITTVYIPIDFKCTETVIQRMYYKLYEKCNIIFYDIWISDRWNKTK